MSWIQAPAFSSTVDHSREESPGYPSTTPSTAFAAPCPSAVASLDAVTVAVPAMFVRVAGGAVAATRTIVPSGIDVKRPSATVSSKPSVASAESPVGATNVGVADVGSSSATAGPETCRHE